MLSKHRDCYKLPTSEKLRGATLGSADILVTCTGQIASDQIRANRSNPVYPWSMLSERLCLKNCKEISLSLFQQAVAIELVTRQRPAGSLARQAFAPTA